MADGFIREVKNFYMKMRKLNLQDLSLTELEELYSYYYSFFDNEILRSCDTELERLENFFAYYTLNHFQYFCFKDTFSSRYVTFLKNIIYCLEVNPDNFKNVLLKQLDNITIPTDKLIKGITQFDNPINNIVLHSNLDTYNYLYYYGQVITEKEKKAVDYFNSISDNKLSHMASKYIDEFLQTLESKKINVSVKKYAVLCYPIGYEKLAKKVFSLCAEKGLYIILKNFNTAPLKLQLDYNHRFDYTLYFENPAYINRFSTSFNVKLKRYTNTFYDLAGFFSIETSKKEIPYAVDGNEVFKQSKLVDLKESQFNSKYERILGKYIDIKQYIKVCEQDPYFRSNRKF